MFEIQNNWAEEDGLNMATVCSHPMFEDEPVDEHFLPVIKLLKQFFPDIQKECGYESAHFLTYNVPVLGLGD